jgi:hypothetical protein
MVYKVSSFMKNSIVISMLTLAVGFISCDQSSKEGAAQQQAPAPVEKDVLKDSVTFYSVDEQDDFLQAKLVLALKENDSVMVASEVLSRSNEGAPSLVILRTGPGEVELHEQWDDVAIIRSGSGVLITGDSIVGDQRVRGAAPIRDWLGGVIQNPSKRSLLPGDFVMIPAMVPHQYIPTPGDSLTYWTIKVRREE